MHVLLLFVDGVGIGPATPDNPLAGAYSGLHRLSGGQPWTAETPDSAGSDCVFRSIDACLGIEGLPQSGTGQATLFTGINCARLAGRPGLFAWEAAS